MNTTTNKISTTKLWRYSPVQKKKGGVKEKGNRQKLTGKLQKHFALFDVVLQASFSPARLESTAIRGAPKNRLTFWTFPPFLSLRFFTHVSVCLKNWWCCKMAARDYGGFARVKNNKPCLVATFMQGHTFPVNLSTDLKNCRKSLSNRPRIVEQTVEVTCQQRSSDSQRPKAKEG